MAIIKLNPAAISSIRMKLIFLYQKIKYGKILEPVIAWGHIPSIFFKFINLWKACNSPAISLDHNTKSLICYFIAKANKCAVCINLHGEKLMRSPEYQAKLAVLDDFAAQDIFSPAEKIALQYAQCVTNTPVIVPAEIAEQLRSYYADPQIVELTALIAFQNMSSKFNAALGVTPLS